jgi:hypothetical protein
MFVRGAAQEARARGARAIGRAERANDARIARESEIVVRGKIVRRRRCGGAERATAILAFEFFEPARETCEVQLRHLVERAREVGAEVEELARRR